MRCVRMRWRVAYQQRDGLAVGTAFLSAQGIFGLVWRRAHAAGALPLDARVQGGEADPITTVKRSDLCE